MKDRVARKMEQDMRHRRTEKLSRIDYTLAYEELYQPEGEITFRDPESGTQLTFHPIYNGAYGREVS